ncbi:MAG: hypothetical protein WBG50_26735 [Desulfomonilaceae bacterium]
MIRAKVWFRCAAMHDPVMPIMVRPAVIGWKGKHRDVDLVIEREFSGPELVSRMKGWITVDPREAVRVLEAYGRLKCFESGELVVELESESDLNALQSDLEKHFGDQCNVDPVPRGA